MRLFQSAARSLMILACAAVTGCSASASDTAKVAERSEHTAHARSGLVGQIIACESKWNEAGAVNDSRATSACRLSIDGTVVACRPDHDGRCTLAMPNGSDVATAQVDFAFDPNDASYPRRRDVRTRSGDARSRWRSPPLHERVHVRCQREPAAQRHADHLRLQRAVEHAGQARRPERRGEPGG